MTAAQAIGTAVLFAVVATVIAADWHVARRRQRRAAADRAWARRTLGDPADSGD